MEVSASLIGSTDALIGTIVSFLKQEEVYKIDLAWLMYFLSKTFSNQIEIDSETSVYDKSEEQVFLQGIFKVLKKKEVKTVRCSNLSCFFTKIKKQHNVFLAKEFSRFNIGDKYFIDGGFREGIDYISHYIAEIEKIRKESKNILSENAGSENNSLSGVYFTKSPSYMKIANLYVFLIIWIVLIHNGISKDKRNEIFLRLNLIFETNFLSYLKRCKINWKDFEFNESIIKNNVKLSQNDIVRLLIKYIFKDSLNNKIESELFTVSTEMFNYKKHYEAVLCRLRNELNDIESNDLNLTKEELKYAVPYWLLGSENTSSFTGQPLGNKDENFYFWLKKVSEHYIEQLIAQSK